MVFTGAISEGDRVASRSQMETAADRRIMPEIAGRDGNKHMAAMLDDEVADPDRANAELRRRLSEALAERDEPRPKRLLWPKSWRSSTPLRATSPPYSTLY